MLCWGVGFTTSTELGRRVSLEDWIGFHRDRLLSVLYQIQEMGEPRPGFELSMISGVTGLPRDLAAQLVTVLVDEGHLLRDGERYRLTESGTRWVRESPDE
jgi:predicted transcriptional regulator